MRNVFAIEWWSGPAQVRETTWQFPVAIAVDNSPQSTFGTKYFEAKRISLLWFSICYELEERFRTELLGNENGTFVDQAFQHFADAGELGDGVGT